MPIYKVFYSLGPSNGSIASNSALLALTALFNNMPSMHLYMVHKKFEGYRNGLDQTHQEDCDGLVFEVAGMREETLVIPPRHKEAMLIEHPGRDGMQLQKLENRQKRKNRKM